MLQFHSHPFSLSTFLLGALLDVLAKAQAQAPDACNIPDFPCSPATEDACNGALNYPCSGVNLCCPLPAVCIPDASSGNLQYLCVGGTGSGVDSGEGGISSGGSISPTIDGPNTGTESVVIPTPPAVIAGGDSASLTGGGIETPLPLPPDTPTTSIPLPSTFTPAISTSTPPILNQSVSEVDTVTPLPLPPSPPTAPISHPSTIPPRSSPLLQPLPGPTISIGEPASSSNDIPVVPVT